MHEHVLKTYVKHNEYTRTHRQVEDRRFCICAYFISENLTYLLKHFVCFSFVMKCVYFLDVCAFGFGKRNKYFNYSNWVINLLISTLKPFLAQRANKR